MAAVSGGYPLAVVSLRYLLPTHLFSASCLYSNVKNINNWTGVCFVVLGFYFGEGGWGIIPCSISRQCFNVLCILCVVDILLRPDQY